MRGMRSWFVALLMALLIISITTISPRLASPAVVLEEHYDNLTVGTSLPGWVAVQPGRDSTLPFVQADSFQSAPRGAAVRNDFNVMRSFSPVEGTVTIELWMDPKVGSDTNNILRLMVDGVESSGVFGKNESDRWFYSSGNSSVFLPL